MSSTIYCLHTNLVGKQTPHMNRFLSSKCHTTCNKLKLYRCLTGLWNVLHSNSLVYTTVTLHSTVHHIATWNTSTICTYTVLQFHWQGASSAVQYTKADIFCLLHVISHQENLSLDGRIILKLTFMK